MKLLTVQRNGQLILYFKGDLDHHNAKNVMKKIESIIDDYLPRDCIMDLSGLSFMDSSGIAIILRVTKRLNEMGGRAWVENPGLQPLRVIDASGIDRIVKVSTNAKERI